MVGMNINGVLLLLTMMTSVVVCIDNGIGLLPPMGWRSWNCYGGNVNQTLMEGIMDRMAARVRTVDGHNTSLADLGYIHCGLDDNWQKCGAGIHGSFHDKEGNPIVNTDTFPDMKAMTDHAHDLGLMAGWYMNNCICAEKDFVMKHEIELHMVNSAKAVAAAGFDGVKLDGCGEFRNLTWWADLLNATGRPIMIENCHWGQTIPGDTSGDAPCDGLETPSDCPYNFFRTSGDIRNTWDSMFANLQTTIKYQGEPPLARPGTWAYPDMLEVGRMSSFEEDRTHFGAWVITSSPLILGYDLNDDVVTDRIWPIIANPEAIAINQVWYGHPGRLAKQWTPPAPPTPSPPNATHYFAWAVTCSAGDKRQQGWAYDDGTKQITNNGQCLSPSSQKAAGPLLEFVSCDSTSTPQQFTAPASGGKLGEIKHADSGLCLDTYDFKGPVIQLYKCNGGSNQQFAFSESKGTLTIGSGQCAADVNGPPSESDTNVMQLWSKPVAKGTWAALVINGDGTNNNNATLTFADIGLPEGSSFAVRDVWERKNIGTWRGGVMTTDVMLPHDSKLYVFSAQ